MKRNAIVLQSGGSTAVINQSLAGVIDGVRQSKNFGKLYGSRFGILGILKPNWILLNQLSKNEAKRLRESPSSALGSCRKKLTAADAEKAVNTFIKRNIHTIFLIGGNDSAETGLLLAKTVRASGNFLQVIGIPKTIDNDLPGMDHAPGYGSIARFFAIATQEASLDTKAIRFSDPVKIIETMGRNSGWVVAASSLLKKKESDGPHLLYFPERAFDERKFLADVKRAYKKFGFVIIVISETIRDKTGKRIGQNRKSIATDAFGHVYVEGAAQYLASLVESKLKIRARFDKPGTIQRMSLPYISKVDQKEAYQCGKFAAQVAGNPQVSGVEVAMRRVSNNPYKIKFGTIPLQVVAGSEKLLPPLFINREGNFITPAFKKYALPLVGKLSESYLSFV